MTNQLSIKEILFQKYQERKLASLYIAKYNSRTLNPEFWVNDFLLQFTKLPDHPDILKIHKTEKETEYKVDSKAIAELFKFLNYRPLELSKKFIFLFDAQDLSTILSNKMLKIFEEMGENFCLFLMVPDNAQMLATVESRAIKLTLDFNQIAMGKELNPSFEFKTLATPWELIAHLKKGSEGQNELQAEKKFIEQTIDKYLAQSHNGGKVAPETYQELSSLLKTLRDYEIESNFNNAKLSRLTPFFP